MLVAGLAEGCAGPGDGLVTYFSSAQSLSVRHPPTWQGEQDERDGVWYRYFQAPAQGSERAPGVTAMLLAGPLEGTLDSYAESWLSGQQVAEARSETRPGASGRFWRFGTPSEPQSLLLLHEGGLVYGLHVRATAEAWARDAAAIEEMNTSVERHVPERYTREEDSEWGFSLGVPDSWHSTRRLASGQSLLRQYQSPALAADSDGGTVHAFLSLMIEPAPGDGSVQEFRSATLARLGDAHRVMRHEDWREGFRDVARSETQLSSSRMHRYYLASGGRGYCLSCEAREDVFHRIGAWCDLIATTLEVQG